MKNPMRQLLQGEAYPPDTKDQSRGTPSPARCKVCKTVHSKSQPLYLVTPLMKAEYITCGPCHITRRSSR